MSQSKLVKLKTDLKSLKYGHDRPGDSNSGQPYIVAPIPDRSPFAGTVDDGYIRGGSTMASVASAIDTERIKRFIKDTPRGTLFIQRQNRLQFSNPKLETKKYAINGGSGILGGILGLTSGVFNVVNELLPGPTRTFNAGFNLVSQVGATAFGVHFNRHGLSPVQDDNSKYLAVVRYNNENGNNRLVGLKKKLIKEVEPPSKFLNSVNFIISNINALFKTRINTIGLQAPELTIDSYLGGPGSVYGQGRTLIRRFDITSNGSNKQQPVARGTKNYLGALGLSKQYNESIVSTNTDIIAQAIRNFNIGGLAVDVPTADGLDTGNGFSQLNQTAVNYRGGLPAGANGTSNSPTTRNYNNLVSQIKTTLNQTISDNRTEDSNSVTSSLSFTTKPNVIVRGNGALNFKYNNGKKKYDIFERTDSKLLTVHFRAINPFGTSLEEYDLEFSAYMKGFKDNFDATWNEYNYVGRSESFYTYGRFKRSVNFSLDIPCFNKVQLLEKHRALGQLAATTAGSYNNNELLGGVLLNVELGNYLNKEYAILNNISYEIPDESSWDLDEKLAMYLKVNVSLTIIHKDLPGYKVPEVNEKAGFFGYLPNPINGKLPPK